jgi:hypothetical protein
MKKENKLIILLKPHLKIHKFTLTFFHQHIKSNDFHGKQRNITNKFQEEEEKIFFIILFLRTLINTYSARQLTTK